MSPLPLNKLYIDSQFKTSDSVSDSQFTIQLPISADFPANTFFIIDDVCIPHSFGNIETNINDQIFFDLTFASIAPATAAVIINRNSLNVVKVASGNYTGTTLATAIGVALTKALPYYGATSTLDLSQYISVQYDFGKGAIVFTPLTPSAVGPAQGGVSTNFKVLTDKELRQPGYAFAGKGYDVSIPSMNLVLGHSDAQPIVSAVTIPDVKTQTQFTSGFLNLTLTNNIYLSSPNLGCFTTLTARGEQNVIKKIAVNADYGYMIIDKVNSTHTQLECSRVTLTSIEFHLKDSRGNFIPLHGANVSFTIIFISTDA
jgi:hypothetical protein